jgi:hypothetical protein
MTVDTLEIERITAHLAEMQPTHLQQEIDNRRSAVTEYERNISTYSETIAQQMRAARQEQALIDAALAAMGESDWAEHLVREFEQLVDHPRVAGIELNDSSYDYSNREQSIYVTTTPDLRLTRPDTGESRWLGAFRIELNISRSQIRMTNLNTRRGGRDHPHITDGMPCFGGHSSSFMQLLANGDLYVLFELLIQYLETLNLEDEYGRYGSFWFEVTDAELGMPAARVVMA